MPLVGGEMPKPNPRFSEAISNTLAERGLTLRQAEYKTGIDHTTITRMANGIVPSRGKVIEWAEGLDENINTWLELAGYEPIPAELCGAVRIAESPAEYTAMKPGEVVGVLREGIKEADLTPEEREEILKTLQEIREELAKEG